MPQPKLRDYQVREVRALYADYLRQRSTTPHDTTKHQTTLVEIGKLYGVSWHTVRRVGEHLSYVLVPDEPAHPDEGRVPKQITRSTEAKRAERARKRRPRKPVGRDKHGRFTRLR